MVSSSDSEGIVLSDGGRVEVVGEEASAAAGAVCTSTCIDAMISVTEV